MMDSSPALRATSAIVRGLPPIRVAWKGAAALGIRLVGAGLALALQVCLARVLGHDGYGEYAYVFAWLQLMLIFAQGGVSTAALRYVAEYRARGQFALARGFIAQSAQISLIKSVALGLVLAGAAAAIYRAEDADQARNFLIAGLTLPFLTQFFLTSAIVRGLGHVIVGMAISLAQPLLLLGALVAMASLFCRHISSSEALLMNLSAAAVALAIAFALQRYFERSLREEPKREFLSREWLGTAIQMMFASSLLYLQGRTGVIITGLLLGAGHAATYAAIERLADAALLGLFSVNMLVAPKFASLYAQQRRTELQRYARLAAFGATGFMLATVLPLALFGKPILRCFGDEFVVGYPALLVLFGGVVINALCGSVNFLLNMTGYQQDMVNVAFISLCLNLLLSLLLIPRYGIMGTAVANAVSIAALNIVLLIIARWRLRIWACIGHCS